MTTNSHEHIPLTVPMIAMDETARPMTRDDAKRITQRRSNELKRLEQLDGPLSNAQAERKKRISRLEKNRLAAAQSRKKKKEYISRLEKENAKLKEENTIQKIQIQHLRELLNAQQNFNNRPFHHPIPIYGPPPVKRQRISHLPHPPPPIDETVTIFDPDEDIDLIPVPSYTQQTNYNFNVSMTNSTNYSETTTTDNIFVPDLPPMHLENKSDDQIIEECMIDSGFVLDL